MRDPDYLALYSQKRNLLHFIALYLPNFLFDHELRSNRGLKNCLVVVVSVVVGLVQVQWLLKYNSPIYENS